MGERKEYVDTLILSKDEIHDIKRAQFEIRMNGFENQNEEKLRKRLSLFTSILSLAFKLPTPVTLAAAIISGITSSPSVKDIIISDCSHGEDYLEKLYNMMDDNKDWNFIKVDLPFLEFVDEGFRYVSGFGKLEAIHSISKHRWIERA